MEIPKATINGWDNILRIERVCCPYHDCKCQFHKLSNFNPNCTYLTMAEIKFAKKRKQEDEDAGIKYYRSISMYDIQKGSTKRTLCGIVLFKLNSFFNHVFSGP